jgi:hypothetical protein
MWPRPLVQLRYASDSVLDDPDLPVVSKAGIQPSKVSGRDYQDSSESIYVRDMSLHPDTTGILDCHLSHARLCLAFDEHKVFPVGTLSLPEEIGPVCGPTHARQRREKWLMKDTVSLLLKFPRDARLEPAVQLGFRHAMVSVSGKYQRERSKKLTKSQHLNPYR